VFHVENPFHARLVVFQHLPCNGDPGQIIKVEAIRPDDLAVWQFSRSGFLFGLAFIPFFAQGQQPLFDDVRVDLSCRKFANAFCKPLAVALAEEVDGVSGQQGSVFLVVDSYFRPAAIGLPFGFDGDVHRRTSFRMEGQPLSIHVWISRRRHLEHLPMRTGLGAAPEETNRHQLRVPMPAIAAASSAFISSGGETSSLDLVMALPSNRKHLWAPHGTLFCSWARRGCFRHRLAKFFFEWIEFVDRMPLVRAISLCRGRAYEKWHGSRKNRKSTPANSK
jgi:hypothetical protein